jgi:hypothetical protein
MPLENSTDFTFRDSETREYSPNYPQELMNENFKRHQALIANIGVSWRPGTRYVEFPDRKMSMGSKYPTFSLSLMKGIQDALGSDINYAKWKFGIHDDLNLKLFVSLRYNLSAGGFLQRDSVAVPDYQHFNGNKVVIASPYLSSFQLLPYYEYSNTSTSFFQLNLEHHFNGMLTNKIPLFRKLNWHLVTGVNGFYLNSSATISNPLLGWKTFFALSGLRCIRGIPKGGPSTTGLGLE